MTALRRFLTAIRERFSRSRVRALPLQELLDRAGVPRSAPPELLEFSRLADLRLDGDGDDGGGDDGDSDGDDDDDAAGDDDDDGSDGDGDDDEDGTKEGDDDDEESEVQKENRALKKRLNEQTQARKKAERKLKAENRKKAEKSGQHKRMYEEEKERADGLEVKLKDGSLERAITAEAIRKDFRSPDLVATIVKSELVDAVDEDGEVDEDRVRDSVKRLAKREPGLIKKTKRQGKVEGDGDDDGDEKGSGDSGKEDGGNEGDKKMSPRERMRLGHEKLERERAKA